MKGKETHAIYLIYYSDLRKGDENEEFMTIRRLIRHQMLSCDGS
jgi:hypothetical protein